VSSLGQPDRHGVRAQRTLLMGLSLVLLWSVSLAATSGAGSLQARPRPCGQALLRAIPARAAGALTGREFARSVWDLSGPARDARVIAQLVEGNIPSFLRHLVPVTVRGEAPQGTTRVTVCVLPDYLAVGSDSDFLYVPLGLQAALEIAARFGDVLPTPKLVDAIYATSPVKLIPEPLAPTDAMRSTAYVLQHTELIDLQRALYPEPLGTLTSGDKKDLVLTDRLWEVPGRVAIYGWQRASGRPIQPLSTFHGARYADYSHGVRLVSRIVYVNGVVSTIDDVLANRELAPLLSREGPLQHLAARLAALGAASGT
jgi:hypothetical protein